MGMPAIQYALHRRLALFAVIGAALAYGCSSAEPGSEPNGMASGGAAGGSTHTGGATNTGGSGGVSASGGENGMAPGDDAGTGGGASGSDDAGAVESSDSGPAIGADAEQEAASEPSEGGGSPGSVDWTDCGAPGAESKPGVTSAEFCDEFMKVCGYGAGTGYYADQKACLDAYEGRDVHKYTDTKRLCVAYTICAIANKKLKTSLCGVPEIYRCGGHRDDSPP
jgi:hypothetical protein